MLNTVVKYWTLDHMMTLPPIINPSLSFPPSLPCSLLSFFIFYFGSTGVELRASC
jgi:hypothetical protein